MQHYQAKWVLCLDQSEPESVCWPLYCNKILKIHDLYLYVHNSSVEHTSIAKAKLSADNSTVRPCNKVITDSAPKVVMADLHSTFIHSVAINKPDSSLVAKIYPSGQYYDKNFHSSS